MGVKIKYKNKILIYTGDIGSDNKIVDLLKTAKRADVLISEASCPQKTASHFTFEQLKELKEKARIERVVVVHVNPTEESRIKAECRRERNVIMGEDGWEIEI